MGAEVLNKKKLLVPKLRFKGFDEGWRKFLMSEIATKITDGTHDTPIQITEGVPYLTAIHVKDGKIDFDNCYYLDQKDHDIIYKRCNPELGDLLIVNIGAGTATCASVTVDYEFSLKNVALIKPNRSIIYPDYLSQLQRKNANRLFLQLTSGGAQPFLSLRELGKLKIDAPSIPEQKKISSFLSSMDEKIQQLKLKKELLEKYKKGVMQQLFSGKLRFKDEKGKEYPEWEEKLLGDVCDVKGGKRIPLGYSLVDENNGHPYITVSDIVNSTVSISKIKYIPLEAIDLIKNYKITVDDLFISVAGTLGLVGRIPKSLNNANLTENCNKLTNIKCDQMYLMYFLKTDSLAKLIRNVSTIGAQPKLAIYAIKSLKIPVPTIKEQQKIGSYLSTIDSKIECVSTQIKYTQTFKKGLLQQMFV